MRKLFRRKVPEELVQKVVRALGFPDLYDRCEIGYKHCKKDEIEPIMCELYPYYTPCYAKIFLAPDMKKLFTVARQLLKVYDIKLLRRKIPRSYFYRLVHPKLPEAVFEVSFT